MATKSKPSPVTTEANESNTTPTAQPDNAQQPQAVIGRPIVQLKADFGAGKIPLAGDFEAVIDVAAAGCKAVGIVPGQEAVQTLTGLELDASGKLKVKVTSPINLTGGVVGIDASAIAITGGAGVAVTSRTISIALSDASGLGFDGTGDSQTLKIKTAFGITVNQAGIAINTDKLKPHTYAGGGSPGLPINYVLQDGQGLDSYFAAFSMLSSAEAVATIVPFHGLTLEGLNPVNFHIQELPNGQFVQATRVYGSTSRATVYFRVGGVWQIRVKLREILSDTTKDVTRQIVLADF
jgi:hypothetical protein